MNKEIKSKFSLKTRLALALSILAFVTAGCGNFKTAPSYGDCLNAGGSNEQCLDIWDPHALEIQKTAEGSIYEAVRQATQDASNYQAQQTRWANEDMAKEATKNAPRHQLAIVQPGEGILDVLNSMGIQTVNVVNPMQLSQAYSVVSADGKLLATFTFQEILNGFADSFPLQPGDCVGIYNPKTSSDFDPKKNQENYTPLIDACFGK